MKEILSSKELLNNSDCTFVSIKEKSIYTSKLTGVAPILSKLIEDKDFFKGASIADVIIGKASAMLLIYGGVSHVYTKIISNEGLRLLQESGIEVDYDDEIPYVLNRKKDGMCPLEQRLMDVEDPNKGFTILSKIFILKE